MLKEQDKVVYIRGDLKLYGDAMYFLSESALVCWVYHKDNLGTILAAYKVWCDPFTGVEFTLEKDKGQIVKIENEGI